MMLQMVLQRIGIGFATLIAVSIIVFVGTSILPGDVAQIILVQSATPETLAVMREKLGLNDPGYVSGTSVGWEICFPVTLGISKAGGASITSMIGGRLGNTMFLAGMVAIIAVPMSVMLRLICCDASRDLARPNSNLRYIIYNFRARVFYRYRIGSRFCG